MSMPTLRTRPGFAAKNRWGCLLAILLALGASASFADDSPIRSVHVDYDGETYVLNAVMYAPVAQAVAWDVLTDVEHMARWVPNVAESKVLDRSDNTVTVEQHGIAKYGAISFPYVTERKLELKPPNVINSAQVRGSLRRVESKMLLEPEGKGTRLTYHLEIVPSLLASTLLSKSFVEHELIEQFTAIIAEMARRGQPS